MTVVRRWVLTTAWRLGAFLLQTRWIVLSVVLAAAGVIGLYRATPAWLNWSLALVSLVLLVLEVRAHAARLASVQFVDRVDDFQDVAASLRGSDRFRVVDTGAGHVVLDSVAAAAIARGTVVARLSLTGYVLPRELRGYGAAFCRRRVSRGATYNGHLLGLATDVGTGPTLPTTTWNLVPARYWDHLGSDIFATKDVLVSGRLESGFGRSLFVDRRGRLRDHGESWLLNAIGTSVLALTTDGRLVVVSQSAHNESSGGLLAPSGSGSLEPADVGAAGASDLATIAAHGALRELEEETGLRRDDVVDWRHLGYGRWLEKAGKPELFTVAALRVDSHELHRRRIPSADRPYTLGAEAVRLRARDEWDADPRSTVDPAVRHRLSAPLVAGLSLLVTAAGDAANPAHRLVVGRLPVA
ncbi:hypothetical protein ACFO3K_04555 [Cellulomonas algicola]|uniref:hypothetical protein n=1 Tax=Cellulomonas algicola TaxID=2071633 RepID=UPI001C3FE38D|nr:hypothetical protein [Cellulomonas algicola]